MPALSEVHKSRAEQVRRRMKKVIATLEPIGGITVHGVFARKAFEVAAQHGILFTKQANQKDTTSSVRRFVDGESDTYNRRLDVYEMTCIAFENEAKAAKNGKHADGDLPEAARPPEAVPALRGPGELVFPLVSGMMNTRHEVDPEIEAIQTLVTVLDPLLPDARKRVLQWAVDKFDLEFAVERVPHGE